MIVNVCPSGIAAASPERVWHVLATPERFGEWLQDAEVVNVRPGGPATPGQRIELRARFLGHGWPVVIDVGGVDSAERWIDLTVHLPLGLLNHEHITLAEIEGGRTLVRFN